MPWDAAWSTTTPRWCGKSCVTRLARTTVGHLSFWASSGATRSRCGGQTHDRHREIHSAADCFAGHRRVVGPPVPRQHGAGVCSHSHIGCQSGPAVRCRLRPERDGDAALHASDRGCGLRGLTHSGADRAVRRSDARSDRPERSAEQRRRPCQRSDPLPDRRDAGADRVGPAGGGLGRSADRAELREAHAARFARAGPRQPRRLRFVRRRLQLHLHEHDRMA